MYTYGQPRTGDKDYANFINDKFGSNASRGRSSCLLPFCFIANIPIQVTHTNDG